VCEGDVGVHKKMKYNNSHITYASLPREMRTMIAFHVATTPADMCNLLGTSKMTRESMLNAFKYSGRGCFPAMDIDLQDMLEQFCKTPSCDVIEALLSSIYVKKDMWGL